MPVFRCTAAAPRRPMHSGDAWREAGREPPLNDVLADPIVQALMRRDGISEARLRDIICRIQERLGGAPCRRRAA